MLLISVCMFSLLLTDNVDELCNCVLVATLSLCGRKYTCNWLLDMCLCIHCVVVEAFLSWDGVARALLVRI